jgi:hypothetical protein
LSCYDNYKTSYAIDKFNTYGSNHNFSKSKKEENEQMKKILFSGFQTS